MTKAAATKAKKSPRNYDLGNGVYRFSKTRMFHKKALYKFVGKKVEAKKAPKPTLSVQKPIGGEKNGKTRNVLTTKRRCYYPTLDKLKSRPSKGAFKNHTRFLRPNLTPGTICIVLAGPHKGKRVVLLKQLESGLLLVTGPFKINGCPLRRISQRYVIATQTKINLDSVKIPENLNDQYFYRKHQSKRAKKEEGDIFTSKKETYKPSEDRKKDQKVMDKLVIDAIKKREDKKIVFGYLGSMFGLRSSQYPHRMKF